MTDRNAPRPPRDRHLFDHILRIALVVWLGVIALTFWRAPFLLPMVLFAPIVVPAILYVAGRIGRKIYDPTGSRVPSRSAFSGPESLAVRGRFQEAVAAYELAARDEPNDPEPWLRIARIERSDLKRPQRALEALRAARTRTTDTSPTAQMIGREIADILLRDLGEPTRAMPELARLAAAHPETPIGQWAARELAEMKRAMSDER